VRQLQFEGLVWAGAGGAGLELARANATKTAGNAHVRMFSSFVPPPTQKLRRHRCWSALVLAGIQP